MAGADDKPDNNPGRTVYQPPSSAAASLPPRPNTTQRVQAPRPPDPAPVGRFSPGVVLNHIYEVRRFIDRGGMGEVYEGINVNTDERVAIKVILPHLAEDPNVSAMFRREARTLTRLNHPALVQYRVLANEPQLNALYIVTEFVDGIGLDLMIGQMKPTEDQVRSLLRRLAEGLRSAHELGAIHRDISPDNILAPEGRLDQAKIIDFGIAKDMATSQATIIGSGFAGKLGFVAPEQFGDFNREIGPWTDVYSLGLVMLAFINGVAPDMGTTLVEAVDRRRAGPDLSQVPAGLKPLLTGMLTADPQKRIRSMDEVIAAIDKRPRSRAAKPPEPVAPVAEPAARPARAKSAPPKARSTPPPTKAKSDLKLTPAARTRDEGIPRNALIFAGAAFLAVLAIGLAAMLLWPHKKTDVAGGPVIGANTPAPPASGLERTVEAAVAGADCGWLDYGPLGGGETVTLALTGGARDPDAAAGSVKQAVERAGKAVDLRPGEVKAIPGAACEAVNAFRAIRAPTSGGDVWLSAPQTLLRPDARAECHGDPSYALAVIEGAMGAGAQDAGMILIGPDGQLRSVFNGAAGLSTLPSRPGFLGAASVSGGRFRVSLCQRVPGVYGIALIHGAGPFDMGLPGVWATDAAPTPANFASRFSDIAKAHDWRVQMAWYEVAPGQAAPVSVPTPPPTPIAAPPTPPPAQASGGRHSPTPPKPPKGHKVDLTPLGLEHARPPKPKPTPPPKPAPQQNVVQRPPPVL